MKYVCLWIPERSTVAERGADVEAALLELVPRVAFEQSGLIWCDARGVNDNNTLAARLLARLEALGIVGARAGVADVPIVAELAARPPVVSVPNLPLVVTAIDSTRGPAGNSTSPFTLNPQTLSPQPSPSNPSPSPSPAGEARHSPSPAESTVTVAPGTEPDFLAQMPIGALKPSARLVALIDGVGISKCGALATLEREAVEVRFGAEAVPLWRLARAEDARRIFAPARPDRIEAAIEFLDYVVTDPERLVFSTNALLGNVCEALWQRGEHARRMRITLPLANGEVWERSMRPARPTASRERWLRLARALLERLTVPDAVAGVRLEVEAAEAATAVQGDLFDRGFATASAVENAITRLLEEQSDVLVEPVVEAHPLVERRARWTSSGAGQGQGQGGVKGGGGGKRKRKLSQNTMEVPHHQGRIQYGGDPPRPGVVAAPSPAAPSPAAPAQPGLWPGPGPESVVRPGPEVGPAPALTLQLLPEPKPIDVETVQRRDHEAPVRYHDRRGWHQLVVAAGPDRISGGQWEGAYAREYFRCVTTDGILVWLFRDARRDSWHLHGWWD